MDKFNIVQKTEGHKVYKDRQYKVITMVKKNNKKSSLLDIKNIAERIEKGNPNKKMWIKVLSERGFFTLKSYNESINSIIVGEDDYINGRDEYDLRSMNIYKFSFVLI